MLGGGGLGEPGATSKDRQLGGRETMYQGQGNSLKVLHSGRGEEAR